jgi:hypothetical protein
MAHTPESVAAPIATLRAHLERSGRTFEGFQIVVGGSLRSAADVAAWEQTGVTRLIVSPWRRSAEALAGIRDFAALAG